MAVLVPIDTANTRITPNQIVCNIFYLVTANSA